MIAAVSLTSAITLFDEHREFEAAVETLAREQAALATAVGADFEARLAAHEEAIARGMRREPPDRIVSKLLGGATQLELRNSRIVLVARPGQEGLITTDHRLVVSKPISAALARGDEVAALTGSEAAAVGLPDRRAVAGLSRAKGQTGTWSVVVLASAERLRARERHAIWRFSFGLFFVTAVVATFGGIALRQQRRQLDVARALEVSALERDRDRLLARADKMATVAAVSSGIAHEVATPLGIIMGRIEQVEPAVKDDPRATAALAAVTEQVHRIQRVMKGFLALARGDAPTLVKASPERIARAAVGLVGHRFTEAGVTLEVAIDPELPDIACDPPLFEQAIVNLLLNACDASPRGGLVRVNVTTEDERIVFVVDDEGEGISEETAQRASEPFFTTKGKGRGTGLGLAIAQEIVSHHGGKLRLGTRESPPGTRATIAVARA
jgi:two-component system, NtrC family, sensor kinase